ncbi:hypothetical protein GQ42DRAFT_163591 [Ramicandelaber brevisporus]|nr:hypothetical protein GQ42DRAFT_163591 [Ramicandelaber brevisporus]
MKLSFSLVGAAALAASSVAAYTIGYSGILGGDMAFLLGKCECGRTKINYKAVEEGHGSSCSPSTDADGKPILSCWIKGPATKEACAALASRCQGNYGGKWIPDERGQICPLN